MIIDPVRVGDNFCFWPNNEQNRTFCNTLTYSGCVSSTMSMGWKSVLRLEGYLLQRLAKIDFKANLVYIEKTKLKKNFNGLMC